MEKMMLSNRLSALGHETRLSIIAALSAAKDGMNSTDIAEHVGVMPTNTSAHLNVLRAAGLVSSTKKGRVVTYRLDANSLKMIGREIESLVPTDGGEADAAGSR